MTIREEDLLFDLCREYEKRRKKGMSHEEARQFRGLPPETDAFLEGLFGLTEELEKQGMLKFPKADECENDEYILTEKGIGYVQRMRSSRAIYCALYDAKKMLERMKKRWKPAKAAIWLAGLSIVMNIITITLMLVMKCSGT